MLAAEPAFVLVDTAVVGHLGARALAGLSVGGTLLSLVAMIGGFLDYGTTGRAARWYGAGDRDRAVDEGVTATVLALGLGVAGAALGEVVAGPVLHLLTGPNTAVRADALLWFRVAVLGLPGVLVVLAGNGWMRGVQDTRRPVAIVVGANVASAVASPLLVYVAGMGLVGSAVANVAAQAAAGALFVRALRSERRPWRPTGERLRGQLRVGRDLLVRAAAFQACFLTASAVASRMGTAQVAAHQVGLQLWTFVALLLDSFAIAAQSLVGAALGAGDPHAARATAARVGRAGLWAGAAAGAALAGGWWLLPGLFTSSPAVIHQAHLLWPLLAGMQPLAGVLFALDGVLIGAGDVAFMRSLTVGAALGVFVPVDLAALHWHWGVTGVWAGLTGFVACRLAGMLVRARGERWLVAGDGPAANTGDGPAAGTGGTGNADAVGAG
ncbi:MAG TPA: MATE family efflux transporter [Acidimicrobiales bacterium]|nr:MATE family efflux transporter [Acidimicrobiales bacterium]